MEVTDHTCYMYDDVTHHLSGQSYNDQTILTVCIGGLVLIYAQKGKLMVEICFMVGALLCVAIERVKHIHL